MAGLAGAARELLSGAAEDELAAALPTSAQVPLLYFFLRQMDAAGFLCRTLQFGGQPLATLIPTGSHYRYAPAQIHPNATYRLSRFAYLRREETQMVLESPLAHCQVLLQQPAAVALLHDLARPAACGEFTAPPLDATTVAGLLQLLTSAGM